MHLFNKITNIFNKCKYEYIFLFIALPWGLIQVFLMPPLQTPDEPAHFYRAWAVSNLQLACDSSNQISVPNNVKELENIFDIQKIARRLYSSSIINNNLIGIDIDKQTQNVYSAECPYNPEGYLPQAIGIDFARLLHFPPLGIFYFSRLFNLLLTLLLIFYAIKITPIGKTLFIMLSMLPMSIHQFASLSNDALNIGGLFLFTSIILYYSQQKKLSNNSLILISIGSLILTQIKPGYFVFLALILLLKPLQFKKIKSYIIFLITIILSNILLLFILNKLNNPDFLMKPPEGIVNFHDQIIFILLHPIQYLDILVKNVFLNPIYIKQLIGVLGPLIILSFPNIFYIIFLIISPLFIFIKNKEDIFALNNKQRIIIFIIFLIQVVLISTIFYITYTNPGSNLIRGIQGRYFIAPALLFMFSIYGLFNIKLKSGVILKIFTILFSLSLFFYSVYTIHTYYYEKEYLVIKPTGDEVTFNPLNDPNTRFNNITTINEVTLNSKKDSNIIIKIPTNATGISWKSTAKNISWIPPKQGFVRVYYNINNQKEEFSDKLADWVPLENDNEFFINISLLEKQINKKISGIMIIPTNSEESFKMLDFKIYY